VIHEENFKGFQPIKFARAIVKQRKHAIPWHVNEYAVTMETNNGNW